MRLRVLLFVFLLLNIKKCKSHVSNSMESQKGLIYFKPLTEFVFQLISNADLKSSQLNGAAKIGFAQVKDLENSTGQEILLRIHTMHLTSESHKVVVDNDRDLTRWFSFGIQPNGQILEVTYPIDEDMEVISLKKGLVGMLSGCLHLPKELSKEQSWKYGVNETGSEGPHQSSYTATPSKEGVIFNKVRETHPIEYGQASHEKEIHFHSEYKLPTHIKINDHFKAPHKVPENFDPYEGLGITYPQDYDNRNPNDFPEMSVTSFSELKFLYSLDTQPPQYPNDSVNLVSDTLQINTVSMVRSNTVGFNKTEMWNFIQSNLTCMRKDQFKESLEGTHCFQKLVHLFTNIPERQLSIIIDHFFQGNFSKRLRDGYNRLHVLDALVAADMECIQDLLTDRILLASAPDKQLVERILMLLISNNKTLSLHIVQTVEDLVFHPTFFPAILQDRELQRTAVMTLGAIASNLHRMGRTSEANQLVRSIEDKVGIHDSWNYMAKLTTIPAEQHEDHHFDTAAMVEALGNAGFDRSLDHILSFANSTNTPHILRRSGLHSLRKYLDEKVPNVLLSVSQNDVNKQVRQLADHLYRAHPYGQKKLNVTSMSNDSAVTSWTNTSANPFNRERRGILDPILDDHLTYDFSPKPKDWHKPFGNRHIGASIGYSLRNSLILRVRLLSGVLEVDALNSAYARLNIGILGLNFDLVTANLCFDGAIGIRINPLKEIKCAVVEQFLNAFDRVIQHYISKLAQSIEDFRDWLLGPDGLPNLLDDFGDTLQEIPQKALNALNDVNDALERLSNLNPTVLPPVIGLASDIVLRAAQVVKDFQLDLMEFYDSVSDAIEVILYSASEQLVRALSVLSENIHLAELITAPHTAIENIYKALVNSGVATDAVIQARQVLENAGLLGEGPNPYWKRSSESIAVLQEELMRIKERIKTELGDWVGRATRNKRAVSSDISEREQIRSDVLSILDDTLGALHPLESITRPIQLVANNFFDSTKILKRVFQRLRNSYLEVKSEIIKILGPNVHKDFPREIRLAGSTCSSNGFYPTTADGFYNDQGVDLVTYIGQKIVAPYSGTVSRSNDTTNRIQLIPSDGAFINTAVYIDNIDPAVNIPTGGSINVVAGTSLGVTANNGPCGSKHIHFVVKTELGPQFSDGRKRRSQHSKEGTQDSSGFLNDRLLEITAWTRGCDDFRINILGFASVVGSITKERAPRRIDSSPERVRTGRSVGKSPLYFKSKRDVSNPVTPPQTPSWFREVEPGIFRELGLPIPEFGKPFPVDFNLRNLKVGPVLEFFDRVGLTDIASRLTNVLQSVAVLIADTPCVNPNALTKDQLVQVLYKRGESTEGSRSSLMRRYLSPDDRCPLLQLSLPRNTFCHIDQTCLAIECCLNLPIFTSQISVKVFARYDPCRSEIVVGVPPWTLIIPEPDVGIDRENTFHLDLKLFGDVKFKIRYVVEKTEGLLLVSLSVAVCPTDDTCLPSFDVLKESAFMLPSCDSNEILSWPDVNVFEYFQRSNLATLLAQSGRVLLESGIDEVAEILNLSPDITFNIDKPCRRPENMSYVQLVQTLISRGQNATGTTEELIKRLIEVQKECRFFSIPEFPPSVSEKLYCSLSADCLRVDCCLKLEVASFEPSFNVFMEVNPCNLSFAVGFESVIFSKPLSDATGNNNDISGKEQVGWITMSYSLRNTLENDEYAINFGISVCSDNSDCTLNVSVLENVVISVPSCNTTNVINAGSIRKKRQELSDKTIIPSVINYDNTRFGRSVSYWNQRLATRNTTFSATENMNTRLLPTQMETDQPHPRSRSQGWVPLQHLLDEQQQRMDRDYQNSFNLPLEGESSAIWPGMSVIGGGLTENGADIITRFLKEQTLKQIESILDSQALHRLKSVRDQFQDILDKVNRNNLPELLRELQQIFRSLVEDAIDDILYVNLGNEFEARDFIINAVFRIPTSGRIYITPFGISVPIPVAFLILRFEISFGAGISVEIPFSLNIGEMTYNIGVTPGAAAVGRAGLSIGFVVYVGVEFVIEILGTDLPITREANYCKFPIEVTDRVDIIVTPLVLRLFVKIEIKVWFVRKTLYRREVWKWSTPSFRGNIKKDIEYKEDYTIPNFFNSVVDDILNDDGKRKRALPEPSKSCLVEQIPGLDYTEPAFQLQVAATDDVSYITYSYSVGTEPGGNEVVTNQLFGGPSAVISEKLSPGVPLFFTVSARNSGGGTATATCHLPTYDITVPGGRVDAAFSSTSHPGSLKASAVLHEDSEIIDKKAGVGYGTGLWGDQVIPWQDVVSTERDSAGQIDDEFDHFTTPRMGKLVSKPVATLRYLNPNFCARDCLALPPSKCLGFNYDYGTDNTCELLQEIEGHGVELHKTGLFSHYERLGVGHAVEIDHSNLQLVHNNLYYFNIHTVNVLGYESIVSSKGILVDFIPPEPGPIANASRDEVIWEECVSFTPEEWQGRCVSNTPLQNHRIIVDGKGSNTVFNGHTDLEDLLYTRANKFISANWDGFHDNETGIYGYTWSVGTSVCEDDVSAHIDPHSHLFDEAECTHEGVVTGVKLEDGLYFITVRALNKVEFGGPMAVSVCHTTPYVIDNTPPVVNDVWNVSYDSEVGVITGNVNCSDAESGIHANHFALGRTPRDTYILEWQSYPYTGFLGIHFTIPDGVPAWVKIRAVNNVDLRATGHSETALLVDETPPVKGIVFDGSKAGIDLEYFKDDNEICANWQHFHDPDSGISAYGWTVGLEPGDSDVVDYTPLKHDAHRACANNLTMEHGKVYFSTLVAFNGGYDMLNNSGSSDGVMLDLTPPVPGQVYDGDEDNDIQFSSEPASVSAFWEGFHDPESNVTDYLVSIYRQSSINESEHIEIIHQSDSVGASSKSIEWHHFHLHHNDYVHVNLRTINGAQNHIDVVSDGYRVDLTPPSLLTLGDGMNLGNDIHYQTQDDSISVNWQYEDKESGIIYYQLAIYELRHGSKRKIFPADLDDNSFETISNSTSIGHTQNNLQLQPGFLYITLVKAVNGAKLIASHETTGVRVDSTPPRMLYVRAGVVDGDHEEILNGYVHQSDKFGIKASWRGVDSQSDIMSYWVAVGTKRHFSDIKEFGSIGPDKGGYISGLKLNLTNDDDCEEGCQPVYFVCVKAQNGAGQYSDDICSSPIKILDADRIGYTTDGPQETVLESEKPSDADVDVQLEANTITVTFAGFASDLNGIRKYEWAIGTTPGGEDVQPYGADGIVLRNDTAISVGLSGKGKAQTPVELNPGLTYYSSVRAITGSGDVLESTSDGVTVDRTAPDITLQEFGPHDFFNRSVPSTIGSIYQEDSTSITATWNLEETESHIERVYYSIGSFPFGKDIASVTQDSSNYIPVGVVQPNAIGMPNLINIQAINSVGLKREFVSPSLVVDTTAPIAGKVGCSAFLHTRGVLRCQWSGFSDPEGGIKDFQLSLGNDENSDDVFRSERLPTHSEHFELQVDDLHLQHNYEYYVTIEAVNTIGRRARAYSKSIVIDDTPPINGVVVELPASYRLNISNVNESVRECSTHIDCLELDAVCLESVTHIPVTWEPFSDTETKIVRYEVAVGSTPFGTQVKPYFEVKDVTKIVINNIDLSNHRQVFVSVRGYNEAGLFSTVSSNGVYISRRSIGLPPLRPLVVRDGPSETDRDFQASLEQIDATWDFSGDSCPVQKFEWAIRRIDGTVIQEFTGVGDQTFGTNSELHMSDGESYYVLVRGTNALGITITMRSDGITVQRDPLIPGHVFDGPFYGSDLNFQLEVNAIHASWTGFGIGNNQQHHDHTGNDEVFRSAASEQTVDYYEVAVGTDRRYSKTRDNIVPFTYVGTNTTIAFGSLVLQPLTSVYYVTVRAHSVSFATSEVSSNGITVGVSSEVIAGEIEVSRFVNSLDTVDVQWANFESTLEMRFYYIGIGKSIDGEPALINCKRIQTMIQNSDNMTEFGVFSPQSTNLDTYKKVTGLKLQHFETYFVTVIGFDEAGECDAKSDVFTVDNTLPTTGQIRTGPYFNMPLDFTTNEEELHVWWHGFNDPESGIKAYHIRLLSAPTCDENIGLNDLDVVVDWIELGKDLTYHRFVDIFLRKEQPYFVELQVSNTAGDSDRTRSSPIVLDPSTPTAGHVIDGLNFKYDETFHGDTTQISGSFLHLANPLGPACPQQVRDFRESNTWSSINMFGLWNMDGILWDIWYLPEQMSFVSEELHITLERDIRKLRVLSGAYATDANLLRGGKYEVEILAASADMNAITSVVFWDGYENSIGDHQVQLEDKWWEDVCDCCYNDLVNTTCLCDCTNVENYPSYNETAFPNTLKPLTTSSLKDHTTPEKSTTRPPWQIDDGEDQTGQMNRSPQRSCGLQLIPAQNTSQAVVWCRYKDDAYSVVSTTIDLPFDPSKEWHTYGLYFTTTPVDAEEDQWKVEFHIDGDLKAELGGIPELSETTKLVFHVWNKNNYVPILSDDFNPPKTVAMFRGLRLPALPSNLCRYGEPFRGGSSPAVSYVVGVGSLPGIVDVVSFQEVVRPCVPCLTPCDHYHCDKACAVDAVIPYTFTLRNVTLPERQLIDIISTPIFLTIKSILGNGESVIRSSNGVSMDTSPPILDYMFYIDVKQGAFEPVTYQSSNSTIKVYWSFLDDESEIAENMWAIGSQPGSTDLQDFISIGLDQLASNSNLSGILQNNKTYYVTLKGINGAGISKVIECPGVTVLFDSPVPDGVNATALFSEELPPEVYPPSTRKMKNGSQVGMTWTKADDETITRYDYCVGSSEDVSDDIVQCIPVGVNSSGSVSISDGGKVTITSEDNEANLNITEFPLTNNATKHEVGSGVHFNLEPGKTVYNTIRVCNSAELCSPVHSQATTIIADEDEMAISSGGEDLTLPGDNGGTRKKRSVNDDEYSIRMQTTGGLHQGGSLVLGFLDEDKTSQVYDSDAVSFYRSYVVNPSTTLHKASRELKNRVRRVYEPTFYLTSLGQVELNGPLVVNITFHVTINGSESFPVLVFWNPDDQEWQNAAKTCDSIDTSVFQPDKGELSVQICNTRGGMATMTRRRRVAQDKELSTRFFSRETHFAVFDVSPFIRNEPPIIQNLIDVISIKEDEGTIRYQFEASDIDDDDVKFLLDPEQPLPLKGVASLTENGIFTYTPCLDCTGVDDVYILVKEIQTSSEIPPLSQRATFKIMIQEQGDEPIMFVAQYGDVVGSERSAELTVEENTGVNMAYRPLSFVIGAFDVDDEDYVTIEIRGTGKGHLTLHEESRNVPDENDKCDTGAHVKSTNGTMVTFKPCGLQISHKSKSLTWLLSKFIYEPKKGAYGSDELMILARDKFGLVSRHLTINIGILVNPCVNGSCTGPTDDIDCTNIRRSLGFDGYSCECLEDYSGIFCQDYITCEGGQCQTDKPDEKDTNERSITIFSVAGAIAGILLLVFVIVTVIYCKRRRSKGSDALGNPPVEDAIHMDDIGIVPKEISQESLEPLPKLTSFSNPIVQDDIEEIEQTPEAICQESSEKATSSLHSKSLEDSDGEQNSLFVEDGNVSEETAKKPPEHSPAGASHSLSNASSMSSMELKQKDGLHTNNETEVGISSDVEAALNDEGDSEEDENMIAPLQEEVVVKDAAIVKEHGDENSMLPDSI